MDDVDTDRAAGALLGLAACDALGAGYEFAAAPPAGQAAMIGGGLGNWAPGEWTDDTQLAICIAQVTATGSLDVEAIGQRFLDWYAPGPADVGAQTRAILGGATDPGELTARAAAHFTRNPKAAAGNGSLMRTAPVALACLGNDAALAEAAPAVSALTHGDPLAGQACLLWCVALDRAVGQARLDGIRDGLTLLDDERAAYWAARLDEATTEPPPAFAPNGFVVTALQAALAAIWQTPTPDDDPGGHLEAALQTAVSIGNDTDTVAAIAGCLLGARWGASAIPTEWCELVHGWPGFDAGDLTELATASTPVAA